MASTCLLLFSAISEREEVDNALTLTLDLRISKGRVMTVIEFTHTGLPVISRECLALRETEPWPIVKTFSTS